MTSREALREWWPSMELVDEGKDDALHEGSTVSFKVHQAAGVGRLAPPFHIHCVYTDVEPEQRLREVVTGDLIGVLETLFAESAYGTRITFNWYVRVTKPTLNLLGYVAEQMYRHSHNSAMEEGERGLIAYCESRLSSAPNDPARPVVGTSRVRRGP